MTKDPGPTLEKRQFHRIAFDERAVLHIGAQPIACRVIDLSLKGALIASEDGQAPSIAVGDPAKLCITLSKEVHITMQTTLAHQQAARLGLHCQFIDLESAQHLRRLIELNLADEELLQRELGAMFDPLTQSG